jgi:hypothetical protein
MSQPMSSTNEKSLPKEAHPVLLSGPSFNSAPLAVPSPVLRDLGV